MIAGLTFRDYGLGWDDYTHAEYADLLLRMYGSGFKDTGALSFANLYMYGGGFDMAAALLHKIIPLELFETRRLLGAIVGVIGLAVTWRLGAARRRPACRPRGVAAAGAVPDLLRAHVHESEGCAICRCDGDPDAGPCPAGRGISAAFAAHHPDRRAWRRPVDRLAHSRRAGAWSMRWSASCRCCWRRFAPTARAKLRRFLHVLYVLLPGLILGYLVMGLIWPWSIMEPGNPFQALTYFSHFFEKPWKEMFDGALVSVPDMPWSYLPTLFALQLPEVLLALLLAGVLGSLMSLSRNDVPARRKTILLMLTLAATLPLVIAMVKRPALYNGIRHFIFVIPPMTVLAGAAFAWGMNWLEGKSPQLAARRRSPCSRSACCCRSAK